MAREIDYEHARAKLRGYYAPAQGEAKGPGVLIVHAWLGITESIKGRADRIAALGCSAFACDVFGMPGTSTAAPCR